jgi:hypothetical protein
MDKVLIPKTLREEQVIEHLLTQLSIISSKDQLLITIAAKKLINLNQENNKIITNLMMMVLL